MSVLGSLIILAHHLICVEDDDDRIDGALLNERFRTFDFKE
jgi:hypothetical protein